MAVADGTLDETRDSHFVSPSMFPRREGRSGCDHSCPRQPGAESTAPGGMHGPGKDSSHLSPPVGKAPGEHAQGWAHRVHESGPEGLCAKLPGSV